MHKKLRLLEELQDVDLKIDGQQGEKDQLLGEMAVLEQKVEEARGVLAEKNEALTTLEEERKGLEESLVTETENIARSEARLKEIKTQKEYQAVSKEIAAARKMKTELEEQLLQKITQIDELKGEVAAAEEKLQGLVEGVLGQMAEVQAKIERLEAGTSDQVKARETIAQQVPASLMKRYAMLREKRQGLAVVEARGGSCLGCNMNLPPQLYNNLFRLDEIITCPHCQRVLFLRQEETQG